MLPRRVLVQPHTAEVVTLTLYRGEFLIARQEARPGRLETLADDALLRLATHKSQSVPLMRPTLDVLTDELKEQGFEQVGPNQPLPLLLDAHEPWKSWNRISRDPHALVDFWARWGAWHTSVELFLEHVVGVVVKVDSLRLKLKTPHKEIFVLGPSRYAGESEFISRLCAVHETLGANDFAAGLMEAQFVRGNMSSGEP